MMRRGAGDVPEAGAVSQKPPEANVLGKGLRAAIWHRPSAAELSQAPALRSGAGTLGNRVNKHSALINRSLLRFPSKVGTKTRRSDFSPGLPSLPAEGR